MRDPSPSAFQDPCAIARYPEGPRRNVPGYDSILPMTQILLNERVRRDARVLVVGAGGGLELDYLAQANPGWHFNGVDPSAPMLELASQRLGAVQSRVTLHHGYIQDVPPERFDAATCLLTFHFVPQEQRLSMASEIHRRLQPGAPFVAVHLSIENGAQGERELWMSRYAAFLTTSGVAPEHAASAREKMERELPILTPAQDEAVLREAGFSGVQLFYVGFAFRGWVGYA